MKKLFIGFLMLNSISVLAQKEEISLTVCRSIIDQDIFVRADQSPDEYIVRSRGVRCLRENGQCQQQQESNHDRRIKISIDEASNILPGEVKIYNGKLVSCNN